jgi:isochorismate synthase
MSNILEKRISTKSPKIQHLWEAALSEGFPIALWRLPKANEKQLIIGLSGSTSRMKVDLEDMPEGFVMSPFQGESLFIKSDLHYCFDTDNQQVNDPTIEHEVFEKKYLDKFEQAIEKVEIDVIHPDFNDSEKNFGRYNEMLFVEMIAKAITSIENGEVQKVVLSRTKNITLPNTFKVIEAFKKLCIAYPNAFVSLVYLPEYQSFWLGATPETLVSMDKDGKFRTMSLAGTQSAKDKNGKNLLAGEIRWSHKEIEEQAFVSRYIIECFKKIRLREYEESGPKTVQAGNLMHLRTDYMVDTQALNFPQLGTVMLELLHPTSAVCGMPKVPALRMIAEHELHDREFYSGFLGPVNMQEESHLFVNLRTMKVSENEATLYAGCGITEDSNPVNEWHETEMKIQTLMNVIL